MWVQFEEEDVEEGDEEVSYINLRSFTIYSRDDLSDYDLSFFCVFSGP